ncbi:MAG: hypothetical protein KAS13_05195 [Candidatus Omnitrophica bacterium]|nr:hypothetical protein [Candidatus Omnitrophota bacterium]
MKNKLIAIIICLCICLQGDVIFSNLLEASEKGETSAISFMKATVEDLHQTGQITEREKQEALKLLTQDSVILVNQAEVEKIARRIPIDLNQVSALKTIKELSEACFTHYQTHQKFPVEFSQLPIVEKLNKQRKDGYIFSYKSTEDGFTIYAGPIIPKVSGINNYYTDQTNKVRFTNDGSIPTDTSSSTMFTPFYEHHDPVAYFKQLGEANKYRVLIGRVREKVKNKEEIRHKITIIGHKELISKIAQGYKSCIVNDMQTYGITVLNESVKSSFEIEDYTIEYKYDQTGMKGEIKILAIVDVAEDIVIKINILEKMEME